MEFRRHNEYYSPENIVFQNRKKWLSSGATWDFFLSFFLFKRNPKRSNKVTLQITDNILSLVFIYWVNTLYDMGHCTHSTHSSAVEGPCALAYMLFLARKRSKYHLTFLLDHLPKSQRTVLFSSETSELNTNIFQNMHEPTQSLRDVSWNICPSLGGFGRGAVVRGFPKPCSLLSLPMDAYIL